MKNKRATLIRTIISYMYTISKCSYFRLGSLREVELFCLENTNLFGLQGGVIKWNFTVKYFIVSALHVSVVVPFLREGLATKATLEGPFTSMYPQMGLELPTTGERFRAEVTSIDSCNRKIDTVLFIACFIE